MRTNTVVFWVICAFFLVCSAGYTVWNLADNGAVEWAGTVALGLVGVMGAFLGFYTGRSHAAQGGELPEDRLDANIDDGDPEQGFFSPWSWWPFALGIAVGIWLSFIGVVFTLVCVVGWVYEYYRGYFAR